MNLTVQEILEDLHAAERDCQMFEQKYSVLSEYFYVAYMNGSLDDDGNPDFALWAGSYEVKLNRESSYRNLVLVQSSLFSNLSSLKIAHVEHQQV
ncbi:MAG: hypothetical protein ACRENG_08685 [bacterium]